MDQTLHIQLLGDFHLLYSDAAVTNVNTARLQSLLAYIVLHRSTPQSRYRLAFLFWPDSTEPQARANLRNLVHRLRRALPDADCFLHADAKTLQWRADGPFTLDVADFESALIRANRAQQIGNHGAARAALEEMVALYEGDLLPSCYDDWILSERERLCREFVGALERLILLLEGEHDYSAAIHYAHRLLQHEPLHEASYRHLMRVYGLSGERAGALRVYQTCATVLQRELGVEPSLATQQLYERLLRGEPAEEGEKVTQDAASLSPLGARRHNLPPQLTPFIGREEELAETIGRLENPSCRLLTLVGPGGIGKTRLVVQAAAAQIATFAHGVCFIPLATVSSIDLLALTLANRLDFALYEPENPVRQIVNYLREKHMLLVWDSFEHLLQGTSLLSEILAGAPQVKLLVTSREKLNLRGEWVLEIAGLQYPVSEVTGRVEKYSAVQLFMQNARRVCAGFSPSEAEMPFLVRICQLVEGVPLGIELASAWVPVLDCRAITREIENGLDLLVTSLRDVPERHRSMRAVFEYSWNLLTEEERGVFGRMSVFRGGFHREAAEKVTRASLPLLSALLDKSLLHRKPSGRYEMHELLRQYGESRLDEDSQASKEAEDRHCAYYAEFLHQREDHLKEAGQQRALEEIREEIENVRAAWRWAVKHGKLERIGRMAEALWLFYEMQGWSVEGEETFRKATETLGRIEDAHGYDKRIILGQVLAREGWFCFRLGLAEKAREVVQRGLSILRPLGVRQEVAFCLGTLGVVAYVLGEYEQADQLQQESLAISREIGDAFGMARYLNSLGFVANAVGKWEEAEYFLRESLAIFKKIGNRWGIAFCLGNLSNTAYYLGEYSEAREILQESLAIRREIRDRWGIPRCLNNLGRVASASGEYAEARRLHQESLDIFRETGNRRSAAYSLFYLGDVAFLLGEYGEAERLHQESLVIRKQIGDRRGIVRSLNSLGKVACALHHYQDSEEHLHEALKTAAEIQTVPLVLEVLLGIATLLAEKGELERSLALVTLVLGHPARNRDAQDRAERLLARIEPRLSPDLLATARQRGKQAELEPVVAEMLGDTRKLSSPS